MTNPLCANVQAIAAAMETRTRANGDEFYCLRDGSPEWMRDVIREAHEGGEFLPDDWRYRLIDSILSSLSERFDYEADADETTIADWQGEILDSAVPVYNAQRAQWLASNLQRAEYCDDARKEGLIADDADIWDRLGVGIYMEASEIWSALIRELSEPRA